MLLIVGGAALLGWLRSQAAATTPGAQAPGGGSGSGPTGPANNNPDSRVNNSGYGGNVPTQGGQMFGVCQTGVGGPCNTRLNVVGLPPALRLGPLGSISGGPVADGPYHGPSQEELARRAGYGQPCDPSGTPNGFLRPCPTPDTNVKTGTTSADYWRQATAFLRTNPPSMGTPGYSGVTLRRYSRP